MSLGVGSEFLVAPTGQPITRFDHCPCFVERKACLPLIRFAGSASLLSLTFSATNCQNAAFAGIRKTLYSGRSFPSRTDIDLVAG